MRDAVCMFGCGILGMMEFQVNELFPEEEERITREITSPFTEVFYLLGLLDLEEEAEKTITPMRGDEESDGELSIIPSRDFCDSHGVYAAFYDVQGPFVFNDNWRPFVSSF